MSRLYDRVIQNGCRPLNARHVYDFAGKDYEGHDSIRKVAVEKFGASLSDDEIAAGIAFTREKLRQNESSDVVSRDEVEGAVVVSAEEVADYVAALPMGTDTTSVVDSLTPPFSTTFIEFQGRPNVLDLSAWGVLVRSERVDWDDEYKWLLHAALIGEWKKSQPVGPIVRWMVHLDALGRARPARPARNQAWTPLSEEDEDEIAGLGTFLIAPLAIPDVPDNVQYEFVNSLLALFAPALLAISLMHCRNVDLRGVDPPERLSRNSERKHGRPLTRYHVLEIAPMRRILDTEGEAQTKGLRHALHICRGHFKTFAEEAPLFGRHVGTYWWPAYVRGNAEEGVVEKDYRLRLDGDGIGQSYREADEDVTVVPAAEKADDPDTLQRGLRAHNCTQNLLAAALADAGFVPRSPAGDEPDFDLAWQDGDTVWVAEVKSTTEANEERQLRLAIGQVIRYRDKLSGEGADTRAMIAVENAPFDESWIDLCGREGIALVWPEVMAQAFGSPS